MDGNTSNPNEIFKSKLTVYGEKIPSRLPLSIIITKEETLIITVSKDKRTVHKMRKLVKIKTNIS